MIRFRRTPLAMLAAIGLLILSTAAASAHSHVIGKNGQVIANGQNHYAFRLVDGVWMSCAEFGELANFGPAWYGLETAHHGPDSGEPGKGDACYAADASPLSEDDDVNPAID